MSFPLSDTLSRFELSGENDPSSLISDFCVGVSSNHFVKHGPENSEHKPDFGKKCYMALWRLAGIYSGNVGERDARAHLGADRGRAVPRLTSLVPARLRWGADPGECSRMRAAAADTQFTVLNTPSVYHCLTVLFSSSSVRLPHKAFTRIPAHVGGRCAEPPALELPWVLSPEMGFSLCLYCSLHRG